MTGAANDHFSSFINVSSKRKHGNRTSRLYCCEPTQIDYDALVDPVGDKSFDS